MGDGGRAERRMYERPAHGDAASWDSGRSDHGRYREAGPRMSSGGWERPRGSYRDDEGRGSSRGGRRYSEEDTWGTDGGRSDGSMVRGRTPRDDRMSDRSMRSPRPPARGDDWSARERDRRAAPGMMRGEATPRRGLWGDEETPPRRRMNGNDPQSRAGGWRDPRDPRALRKGLIDTGAQSAATSKKSGLGVGQAMLIILVMFLIGAGAAYGYFRVSAPTVHIPSQSTPATTPATTTPSASPSASPHSNVPATHQLNVVL